MVIHCINSFHTCFCCLLSEKFVLHYWNLCYLCDVVSVALNFSPASTNDAWCLSFIQMLDEIICWEIGAIKEHYILSSTVFWGAIICWCLYTVSGRASQRQLAPTIGICKRIAAVSFSLCIYRFVCLQPSLATLLFPGWWFYSGGACYGHPRPGWIHAHHSRWEALGPSREGYRWDEGVQGLRQALYRGMNRLGGRMKNASEAEKEDEWWDVLWELMDATIKS